MAGNVDQRGLADYCGCSYCFGGQQKGERAGPSDEIRTDQSHYGFARNGQSQRNADLGGNDPVTDLADLACNGFQIACLQIAGDDGAENGVEAGLELLR